MSQTFSSDALTDIELPLPGRRVGKVRVAYELPDDQMLFITTDRLSAFDRIVATVPLKGQVLNQLAGWWFATSRHIVANHALSEPDPNALIAIAARPLPVEVVVRGHITGVTSTSLWRRYAEGQRVLYGHHLPDGLRKNQALPAPLITPTTKAEGGAHDEALTCAEVTELGLLEPKLWAHVQEVALALFAHGVTTARTAGLILADTKYEFGLAPDGSLLLIDEVHTPDSSRFWEIDSYEDRLRSGAEPESLDKEPARMAFGSIGYGGDGDVPELPEAVWIETSARYVRAYERLTASRFEPGATPITDRIVKNLEHLWATS